MDSSNEQHNITDMRARQLLKKAEFDTHVDQVTQDLFYGIRAAALLIRRTRAACGLPDLPG